MRTRRAIRGSVNLTVRSSTFSALTSLSPTNTTQPGTILSRPGQHSRVYPGIEQAGKLPLPLSLSHRLSLLLLQIPALPANCCHCWKQNL